MKTENAAVSATLTQDRERMKALEGKTVRFETSIDALNRKIRDKDEYISQLEQQLSDKQQQIAKTQHANERQRRKFDSKLAHESDKKNRELEMKLDEQKRKMNKEMRLKEEKLRLVTDIVNGNDVIVSEPVSNLITRFNANCENDQVQYPTSDRKPRSTKVFLIHTFNAIEF